MLTRAEPPRRPASRPRPDRAFFRKSVLWIASVLLLCGAGIYFNEASPDKAALVLFAICFACELVDSGLGMGYGTILTPSLLMLGYSPADIVPTILLSELLSGFAAAFFHHEINNVELGLRGKDLKPAALLASGSLAGVLFGVFVAVALPKQELKLLIGCIILLSGLFVTLLARKVVQYSSAKMLTLSIVASFNKAISGGGYGPLVTSGQVLSGVKGKSAVGITSFAEAFTCLVAVAAFLIQGGFISLQIFLPMCAGALCSVPFSVFAISRASESRLKLLIGIVTITMGALTIVKSLPG